MARREALRVVEFYSGVGGWSFALRRALEGSPPQAVEVVAAYDFSTVCNEVYAHNFGKRPSQKPIEKLAQSDLDGVADVWMMSPPCQPHTRQRKALEAQATDEADPRSLSFLHLCRMLHALASPPSSIVLENVVGFETSACCGTFLAALAARDYSVQQFHLTPTQFGYPNDRPRYYLIATAKQGGGAPAAPPGQENLQTALPRTKKQKIGALPESSEVAPPAGAAAAASVPGAGGGISAHLELPGSFEGAVGAALPAWLAEWVVAEELLAKDAAWCFDIVRTTDSRSACFTSSYGRFVKGTGSVLFVPRTDGLGELGGGGGDCPEAATGPDARVSPEAREFGGGWREQVGRSGALRYFTPREVASLMGFPAAFQFPAGLKVKKAYELLGNSIHIGVAARVLAVALRGLNEALSARRLLS